MKAIKIDVVTKKIYEVDLVTKNGTQLDSIYSHLRASCFCVGLHLIPQDDYVYVDDEGLLRDYDKVEGIFCIEGQPQPLVGHGLVVGCGPGGESRDVQISIDELQKLVLFPPKILIKPLLR